MTAPVLVALALVAGALLAAQGPILARLAVHAGGPVQAAIVAFAIGLTALVAVCLLSGTALPRPAGVLRMPVWVWASGLIGTGLLVLTLLAALAYDHTGAFGMELRRVGLRELAGVAFLLAGLAMIAGHQRD